MENQQSALTLNEKRRALKWGVILIVALTVFIALQVVNGVKSFYYIGEDPSQRETITVSGEGEVFAVPDVARFTFSVLEEASSVSEAQQAVSEKVDSAIAMLKEQGIEERDIRTTDYRVNPRYEYRENASFPRPPSGERVLVGFEVNQTTSVKVRDVEKAGAILGELGGLEVTNVSGLQLTIDEPEELERQARASAIQDARNEARRLANDLGVRLGDVVNFNESGDRPVFKTEALGMGGADDAASAPQISTGENRIQSNVNITYEIR